MSKSVALATNRPVASTACHVAKVSSQAAPRSHQSVADARSVTSGAAWKSAVSGSVSMSNASAASSRLGRRRTSRRSLSSVRPESL